MRNTLLSSIVANRWSMCVSSTLAGLLILSGIKIKNMLSIFKRAFSIPTLGVIYSVFLFKNILQMSGALNTITQISGGAILSEGLIIFLAPFIVGFLTGVNPAFVGITFPVLAPIINPGTLNLYNLMFAYASGYSGVLLSPVHLCLALTKEYYCAEFPKVYRYLIPSVAFVFFAAFILFILNTL